MSKSPVTRRLYSVNEKCALWGSALSMRETQHGLKKTSISCAHRPARGNRAVDKAQRSLLYKLAVERRSSEVLST